MQSLRIFAALLVVAVSAAGTADDAVHRYLYLATPDGAQAERASGKGILVFDIDAASNSCAAFRMKTSCVGCAG